MKPDITIIGDINVDIITPPLKKYPEKDRQIIVPGMYLNTGGCACNTAIACSRLDLKTRLIGKLGSDYFSSFVLDKLNETDVDKKIVISKNEKCGITFALTVQESRSFISYKGTNATLSLDDILLEEIEGKLVILTGYNLLDKLRKDVPVIFKYAKEKEMKTGLDPNWDPDGWSKKKVEKMNELLEFTDWFFPDYEEGKAISYTDKPNLIADKFLRYGPEIVCLKLGKKGCLLAEKNKKELIKSYHVESINATGAGDVFLAGFIKKYLEDTSAREAVKFANAAAALSLTKFGIERYPSYQKVNKFMREGEI